MLKDKPIYNYDIDQCNQLFKKGVVPIGIGRHDVTGNTYVVFKANSKYFNMLELIRYENEEKKHRTGNNNKIMSCTL